MSRGLLESAPNAERFRDYSAHFEQVVSATTEDDLRLVAGQELHSVVLRVCGAVTAAEDMTPDGIAEAMPRGEADQGFPEYVLTGVATAGPRRLGRLWATARPSTRACGVRPDCWQGAVPSAAGIFRSRSNGELAGDGDRGPGLVSDYEREAFRLVDTRAHWLVSQVIDLTGGELFVDLHRP
jgi:hypothetical protein